MCYPVYLWQCCVRAESVHTTWGVVGLGRCLILWCSIFLPLVGAERHTAKRWNIRDEQYLWFYKTSCTKPSRTRHLLGWVCLTNSNACPVLGLNPTVTNKTSKLIAWDVAMPLVDNELWPNRQQVYLFCVCSRNCTDPYLYRICILGKSYRLKLFLLSSLASHCTARLYQLTPFTSD